jgi:hypothetical protein
MPRATLESGRKPHPHSAFYIRLAIFIFAAVEPEKYRKRIGAQIPLE